MFGKLHDDFDMTFKFRMESRMKLFIDHTQHRYTAHTDAFGFLSLNKRMEFSDVLFFCLYKLLFSLCRLNHSKITMTIIFNRLYKLVFLNQK